MTDRTANQSMRATENAAKQIIGMLNDREFDNRECLVTLVDVIHSVLGSIECEDCRQAAANSLRELIPPMIADALEAPGTNNVHHLHH